MPEKEFSILSIAVYIAKRIYIAFLFAVIASGTMAALNIIQRASAIEVYEGKIRFMGAYSDNLSETLKATEYIIMLNEIIKNSIELIYDQPIANELYDEIGSKLYSEIETENKKRDKFFSNLYIAKTESTITVIFLSVDKEVAQQIVTLYIDKAKKFALEEGVYDNYFLKETNVKTTSAYKSYVQNLFADELQAKEDKPILNDALIGAIAGITVGILVLAGLFFIDTRIKSSTDIKNIYPKIRIYDDKNINFDQIAIDNILNAANTKMTHAIAYPTSLTSCNVYVNGIATSMAKAGKKTLLITSKTNASSHTSNQIATINSYIYSDVVMSQAVSSTSLPNLDVAILDIVQSISQLLVDRTKFDKLVELYDIIIFDVYDNKSSNAAVIANIASRVQLIINQISDRTSDINKFNKNIATSIDKLDSVIVANLSNSYYKNI